MPSPDTALPTHGIAHADAELRRWSRAALLTVLVAAGVLGGWSVLAPLDSAVVARGLVKVEDYRQIVQHRDGGLVKRILVKNGSHVTKGQPLLELEDSRRVWVGADLTLAAWQQEEVAAWIALYRAVGGGWEAPPDGPAYSTHQPASQPLPTSMP